MKTSFSITQRLSPLVWLILLIAAAFRFWDLEIKPPHFDEGINGHFVMKMWREGYYQYDPTNYHGPLYFYFLQIAETVFGFGIYGFRFVTGLFSLATVFLVAQHARFVGQGAILAAAFLAVSPAAVFYSRYAIHESLFIMLQVLFSYGFFLWLEERSRKSALFMTIGFFGCLATKETFFIFFGTWLIALACVQFSLSIKCVGKSVGKSDGKSDGQHQWSASARRFGFAKGVGFVALGMALTLVLFSGFFQHPKGMTDLFSALQFWTKTGIGETGHEKPWWYWLKLMKIYEWPALVGLCVSPFVFFAVPRNTRVLVIAGFGTWLAYSLIPYKTPWLIINSSWLLAFSAGAAFLNSPWPRSIVWLVISRVGLAVALSHSVWTSARLNFRDHSNGSEPYVYVQSTMEFKHVMDVIAARLHSYPEDLNLGIAILNRDPWPMPWLFGHHPRVQWGSVASFRSEGQSIILIDSSANEELEKKVTGSWWVMPFQIRGSYEKGYAYFEFERFKEFVPSGTRIFQTPKSQMPKSQMPQYQEQKPRAQKGGGL